MPLIRIGDDRAVELSREQYQGEQQLEDLLASHPRLLLDDNDPDLGLVTKQLSLPGTGVADLVFVDSNGLPVVVEVKLAKNPQSRREVLAQVFDYASTLADWTVDELDAATDGAVEAALRSLGAHEAVFKSRWQATGANLRAGTVRVIVATDDATDDLTRVISYINDHSDLDVRLVLVEKYQDPRGETVLASTTPIRSEDTEDSSRSQARKAPQEFQAVLAAYEAMEDRPYELVGKAKNYRVVRVPKWPKTVHYEFMHGTNMRAEIHLEDESVAALGGLLEGLATDLANRFNQATCEFDPSWRDAGRLRLIHAANTSPNIIARNMIELIKETRPRIERALDELE